MNTTLRRTLTGLLAGLALGTSGCLIQEKTHGIYIDPDGSATWMVVQREVRSGSDDPEKRAAEEQAYLDDLASDEPRLVRAMYLLGAHHAEARLVRDERPYAAIATGRFLRAEDAIQRFFDKVGIDGRAELVHEGDVARLTITCAVDLEDGASGDDEDSVLLDLVDDADRYRIILTSGEFVDARGFEIANDDLAVLAPPSEEQIEAAGGVVTFSLAWTLE